MRATERAGYGCAPRPLDVELHGRLTREVLPQLAAHIANALRELGATPRLHLLFSSWDRLQTAQRVPLPLTVTAIGEDTWHLDWEPRARRVTTERAGSAFEAARGLAELLRTAVVNQVVFLNRVLCKVIVRALTLLLDVAVAKHLNEPMLPAVALLALQRLVEASEFGAEEIGTEQRAMVGIAKLVRCTLPRPREDEDTEHHHRHHHGEGRPFSHEGCAADGGEAAGGGDGARAASDHPGVLHEDRPERWREPEGDWPGPEGRSPAQARAALEAIRLLLSLCGRGYHDEVATVGACWQHGRPTRRGDGRQHQLEVSVAAGETVIC